MRFLLTTFGSFGDLHPYIAVGIGLRDRGHTVTIGSTEGYRAKVEGEGLRFHAIRPDLTALHGSSEFMDKAFHPRTGTDYIVRKVFLPVVEQAYEDTLAAARDADILVSHAIAFSTPSVADKLGKPWVGVVLQPSILLSAYDPPQLPFQDKFLRRFGVPFWSSMFSFARWILRGWGRPLNNLRKREGLPPLRNPLLHDALSPYGSQAWFSPVLTPRQPDWPAQMEVTGFPFYDKLDTATGLDPRLAAFLDDGPPPVVFTLGSSAVFTAGPFYRESLRAVEQVGCRAVLLTGPDPRNQPDTPVPACVFIADYARYSQLLPRGAATVHQGGVGTTGQAMRAGRPMLFVPYSHDQPDNAMRVGRLGAARTVERHRYRADRVARELRILLEQPSYMESARGIATAMQSEDGVRAACDGLERIAMKQSAK